MWFLCLILSAALAYADEPKPLQFTPVAAEKQAEFRNLVARIYEFRAVLKSEALGSDGPLELMLGRLRSVGVLPAGAGISARLFDPAAT